MPVAGLGTRLAAVTGHCPKALLPLGDGTVIERLLERLAPLVSDVCLVVGDLGDGVRATLGDMKYGIRLHYVVQEEPRGVAHAVLMAGNLLQGPFVVVMGDCYYDASLTPYFELWRKSECGGAVLLEPAAGRVGEPMGLVRLEGDRVIEIAKEPFRGQAEWRVAGLAILPQAALDVPLADAAQPSGEHEIEEVIADLIRHEVQFKSLHYRGWRRNINTPSDLGDVERHVAEVAGKSTQL